MLGSEYVCVFTDLCTPSTPLHFNFIQHALVLEDYAPALRVRGFVSRKKGARSMGEEKKEGKNLTIIHVAIYVSMYHVC